MLYGPGSFLGLGSVVTPPAAGSDLLEEMRDDTDAIIDEWGETLTVQRLSLAYNAAGIAAKTWNTQGTFSGDWQPGTGDFVVDESGEEVKYDVMIFASLGADVVASDKIVRSTGTAMYVIYVANHEDHMEIYCTRMEGQK